MTVRILTTAFCVVSLVSISVAASTAEQVLEKTGVRGGLVVHLGSGDGESTLGLCANDSYLVHGLDRSQENVDKARQLALAKGLAGRVTFARLGGTTLPYADNVVNLLVASDVNGVELAEVRRVLAPGAVAIVAAGNGWREVRKPRGSEIDEWTHFLYDATNNAVSKDRVVDQPYHLQWIADPKWARSHDHLATISAAVSAGGRVFYIADEGSTAAVALPARWRLSARDAFSGVLLWKRKINLWEGHLRGFRSGPAELPRRLVAVGDRVYVTLGYGEPLCCLDAATGKTLRVFEGTEGTQEIMIRDGKIFLVAGQQDLAETARRRGESPPVHSKRLMALDTNGRVVWQKADADTIDLLPLTPALQGDRLYFENPDHVICLNAQTGSELWRAERPVERNRWAWSTPTLVVQGDVVLSADRAAPDEDAEQPDRVQWAVSAAGGEAPPGEMVAFDANSGEELWRAPAREAYNAPPDLFVTGSTVWSGDLVRARDPGITAARDLSTGEVAMERARDQEYFKFGMGHHRCYRNKATERFLLLGRSGVELLDVKTGEVTAHHYVRGACQYGIFPANGLIYVPSHSCACFIEAKLNGFNALAPKGEYRVPTPSIEDKRLEKGSAYDGSIDASGLSRSDWPTFRRNAARGGATRESVASSAEGYWEQKLGGRLTAPVVAGGKLFVAQRDQHVLHALDADSGEPAWTFVAGGRIDSPPTVYRGRVLFGSADGHVYCLRAGDGELVWRFLAAPDDRRICVYDQLESVWPVPGNVLVVEEEGDRGATAWFVAGRTSYLDGGMFLYRIDAATGAILSVTAIDSRDPETGLPPQKDGGARGVTMPGALPDVLSCDGQFVYMRQARFDLEGNRLEDDVPHLFSPAGFTDDAWWHRTYWIYGTQMRSGWGGWPRSGYIVPAGRLLVADDEMVYGIGRLNQYANHGAHVGVPLDLLPWPLADYDNRARGTTHYRLFASPKEPVLIDGPPMRKPDPKAKKKPPAQKNLKPEWSEPLPITARAMVLAGDRLYLAGPPELLALSDGTIGDQDLGAAQAAYEGKRGAMLCSVSAESGEVLETTELASPPVLDGLIAAGGRLYLVTMDGRVCCRGGKM